MGNCALLDALAELRFGDAVELLKSSGFPVNPNCEYKWKDSKTCFPCGSHSPGPNERDFGDVRESTMSALCLAIRARKTWAANGRVSGEGLQESEVLPVIELLLTLGADVDGDCVEVHTHGSWGAETCSKKPL